jgi:hypothetical protein
VWISLCPEKLVRGEGVTDRDAHFLPTSTRELVIQIEQSKVFEFKTAKENVIRLK